jgi:hypothetical protein
VVDGPPADGPIPAYDGTVFVSYSRADDLKPPFEEGKQGWVKFFWDQLRWELTSRGVHQADLWLDRYKIEPAEDFTQKIEEALQKARVIVPILSLNWIQRPWCQREVTRFVELHSDYVKDGIVPVRKDEVPEAVLPDPLKKREGYKFYAKDSTGTVSEFYWRGLINRDAYVEEIKRIALWIVERLVDIPAPTKTTKISGGDTVYLAAAADELHDAWQRVANDLESSGFIVHPAARLPDTAAAAEKAIREGLAKAVLSVHFIGDVDGAKAAGANEGIVPLQLRLARELSGAAAPASRVLWVPKWLPGDRAKKRDPFDVLKKFGTFVPGEEVYAEEVTDLSQMLRSRLVRPSSAIRVVVAAAAPEDDSLVGILANRLQCDDFKVRARFANDPEPLDRFDRGATMVLIWGMAGRASIDTFLDPLVAQRVRVVVLALAGGDWPAKQHFVREGAYVEQVAEIPPDRKSARQLLTRLEITPVADGSKQAQ